MANGAPNPNLILVGCMDAIMYPFSFRTNTSNPPDQLRDGKAGVSVVRTSPGLYTVQLPKPYPAQAVSICATGLAIATGGTADQQVRYVRNSYSSTTGQFQLMLLLDDGTPAIGEAGVDDDEVHVIAVFNRRSILNQT